MANVDEKAARNSSIAGTGAQFEAPIAIRLALLGAALPRDHSDP